MIFLRSLVRVSVSSGGVVMGGSGEGVTRCMTDVGAESACVSSSSLVPVTDDTSVDGGTAAAVHS